MKPVYTLSGRDLSMIKYNDFINKKPKKPRNFVNSEAFLRVRCEEVKNLVKHINYIMHQYWHK